MTIRGGGHPKQAMVLAPVSRMGPPPRSFAADAHYCIMVRSLRTYRIQGCGAMIRARWQKLPSDHRSRPRPAWTTRTGTVKARPGNDGACGQGRATADLDRPVRVVLNTCVGRGEETGFQVEQRNLNEGKGEWCKMYA